MGGAELLRPTPGVTARLLCPHMSSCAAIEVSVLLLHLEFSGLTLFNRNSLRL